jgi:hypothetical protein
MNQVGLEKPGALDLGGRRVLLPPLPLPPAAGVASVCVAASGHGKEADAVVLANVAADGRLSEAGRWSLKEKERITAGPFLLSPPGSAVRLGCVVNGRTLVCLDPAKPGAALWRHGDGAGLLGRPQTVGGLVLLADEGGNFVGLDLQTGTVRGSYRLPGSVTAAAVPVPFGPGRLFAPLSDGTVLLLPLELLHGPK